MPHVHENTQNTQNIEINTEMNAEMPGANMEQTIEQTIRKRSAGAMALCDGELTPSGRHFRNRILRPSLIQYEGAAAKILDNWHEEEEEQLANSVSSSCCVSPCKKKARQDEDANDVNDAKSSNDDNGGKSKKFPSNDDAAPSTCAGSASNSDAECSSNASSPRNVENISDYFLEYFATESILNNAIFVGHVNTDCDSVCGAISAAYLFNGTPAISEPAESLNGEIEFALKESGIDTPIHFDKIVADPAEDIKSKKICLVDHSEKKQMVPYLRENINQIVGVIDHHALASSFYTEKPIYMDIRPWGCMCTILTHSYLRMGKAIPKHMAKLMLSAVLSDTLNLKSPTTTKADKFAVCLLAAAASVSDIDAYAARQFQAKTEWACGLGGRAMTRADCKEFEAHGKKLAIAVLEIAGSPAPVVKHKEDIIRELEILRQEKGADYIFFFVVDVLTQTSVMILRSELEDQIANIAFGLEGEKAKEANVEANLKHVGNYASRKKEFFPMIQVGLKTYLEKEK